jgi:hypothetical protein
VNLVWVTLACFSFARTRPRSSYKQYEGYDGEDCDHYDDAEQCECSIGPCKRVHGSSRCDSPEARSKG